MTRCYAAGVALRARRGRRDDDGDRRRRCHARAVLDDRPADLVLRGGRIATMDPARQMAEALAVVDGRIVAVGPDAALRRWIGPRTRVIDLRGRTVTPGFGDAHVHPVTSGLDRLRCDLTGVRGPGRRISTSSPRTPRRTRTRPGSAAAAGRWPTSRAASRDREDLDRIVPDRPVYLETATGTRPGSTAWPWRSPGSRPRPPIRATAGSSATRTGRPSGTLQEGARGLVAATPASGHGRGARGGRSASPRRAPRARDHHLAGRDQSSPRPRARTRRWPTAAS